MGNLVYVHLLGRTEHAEGCVFDRPRGCTNDCTHRQLHEWLDGPLLPAERRAAVRVEQRGAVLLAGDIPT